MSYVPEEPLNNEENGVAYASRQLFRLSELFNSGFGFLVLAELSIEPKKVFVGMVVLADGTNWNPGAGQGVYAYYAAAWHKLG